MVLMASTRGLGPRSLGSSPDAPTIKNQLKKAPSNFNFPALLFFS